MERDENAEWFWPVYIAACIVLFSAIGNWPDWIFSGDRWQTAAGTISEAMLVGGITGVVFSLAVVAGGVLHRMVQAAERKRG